MNTPDTMMTALEEAATAVSMMTGIKAQFVEAGWAPENAELMTVELFRASNKA